MEGRPCQNFVGECEVVLATGDMGQARERSRLVPRPRNVARTPATTMMGNRRRAALRQRAQTGKGASRRRGNRRADSSGACRAPRCRSPRHTERCHPPSAADQRSPCRLPIRGSRSARSQRFRRSPRTRAVLSHLPVRKDLGGRAGQVAPRPQSRRGRPSGPSDQPVPVRRARLAVRPGLADPLPPADPRGQAVRQIREDLGGQPDLARQQLPGGQLGRPVPEGIRSNPQAVGWRTGQ